MYQTYNSNSKSATPTRYSQRPGSYFTADNKNMGNANHSHSFNKSPRSDDNISNTNKSAPRSTPEPSEAIFCDVMISYSHEDKDFALKMKEVIESNDLTVWLDSEFLSEGDKLFDKIGEAISNAKIVLPIISEHQVVSKFCIGEVALAYISGCTLFPCGLGDKKQLLRTMPPGMRLQLAEFEWYDYRETDSYSTSAIERISPGMVENMKRIVSVAPKEDNRRPRTADKMRREPSIHMPNISMESKSLEEADGDFWEDNFGAVMEIEWLKFKNALKKRISKPPYDTLFLDEFEDLVQRLYKELNVSKTINLKKRSYTEFLMENNSKSFLTAVRNHWSEVLAVKNVFDIDSKMRVKAIEKLAKYPSKLVIEALFDLIEDGDPNTRAVSIITLAKIINNPSTKKMGAENGITRIGDALNDSDRLVRESACLALGSICDTVPTTIIMKIVKIWRNDVIASVRQCAELALRRFDNEEARMAVHMTEILKSEIEQLKTN